MSKLADLIRLATSVELGPLGFSTSARKRAPTLIAVALVAERWPERIAEAVSAGADAVLLTGRPRDDDVSRAVAAADGRSCGILMADDAQFSRREGVDFTVVSTQAPAAVLQDDDGGPSLLLYIRDELSDTELRAIEGLPIDGAMVDADTPPLSIRRAIQLQRLSGLTRKALLIQVRSDVTEGELLTLRDAGVALVAVDVRDRGAAAISHLRTTIDALPARRRPRRRERSEPVLPRVGVSASAEPEDDDDDDDD
jgi:hypothetical protein